MPFEGQDAQLLDDMNLSIQRVLAENVLNKEGRVPSALRKLAEITENDKTLPNEMLQGRGEFVEDWKIVVDALAPEPTNADLEAKRWRTILESNADIATGAVRIANSAIREAKEPFMAPAIARRLGIAFKALKRGDWSEIGEDRFNVRKLESVMKS